MSPAPEKNEFWKARSKHGRDKIFSTPEILWEAACEYFEWAQDNPWYRNDPVKAGPNFGEYVQTPVERPMTVEGLCIFLDVETKTFNNYTEGKGSYKDFLPICLRIKEIIRTQKFEGAAVGTFNANIIARDLGLKDHIESEVKTQDTVNLTEEQLAKVIESLKPENEG